MQGWAFVRAQISRWYEDGSVDRGDQDIWSGRNVVVSLMEITGYLLGTLSLLEWIYESRLCQRHTSRARQSATAKALCSRVLLAIPANAACIVAESLAYQ